MRKLCVVIVVLIQFAMLSAYIEELTSFSNGRAVFEYDTYSNAILKYDDRLILQSSQKIEEF